MGTLEIPEEMQNHPVSLHLSFMWDGFDVWGSAMAEGFALCDFVTFYLDAQEEIPESMGYRPAMAGPDEETPMWEMLVDGFESGAFTRADVIGYLPILERYLDACKAAGLDY